jgi:hypothetical protein
MVERATELPARVALTTDTAYRAGAAQNREQSNQQGQKHDPQQQA